MVSRFTSKYPFDKLQNATDYWANKAVSFDPIFENLGYLLVRV